MENHRSCAQFDSSDHPVRSHECDKYLCRAEEFYEVFEAFDAQAKAAGLYRLTEGLWHDECGYRAVVCSTTDGVAIASVLQRRTDWYIAVESCVAKAAGSAFLTPQVEAFSLKFALQWVDIITRLYLKAIEL